MSVDPVPAPSRGIPDWMGRLEATVHSSEDDSPIHATMYGPRCAGEVHESGVRCGLTMYHRGEHQP